MKMHHALSLLLIVLIMGCSQPVLRQDVPVSTNPMGAKIYADGKLVGMTPMSVPLERDRNHILTLVKDDYRQEDVIISKAYQKEKTYLNAISAGVNAGLFFKDPRMGVGSAMSSMSAQEKSGEAFILVPQAVKIDLTPLSGASRPDSAPAFQTEAKRPADASGSTESSSSDDAALLKGLAKIGAAAVLSGAKPLEKNIQTSSSSRSYTRPDGTRVTEKSGTSVGVSVNPAGLINVIDVLFK